LEQRLVELPADQEIVAYCRGPWCVLSFEAVALLRQLGYRARRLEDGFPEWKTAGLPIGHSPQNTIVLSAVAVASASSSMVLPRTPSMSSASVSPQAAMQVPPERTR
jgi:3-mercaptopyruvate sulfurtransferase SseA